MIGYYIHHHGTGHLARARAICAALGTPVTALSSLTIQDRVFDQTILLPQDDLATDVDDPTASGALHWVPRGDHGLCERMAVISQWIATTRPAALVVDVSVEVALLARLHGVPVVTMALPGTRTDPAHTLVHRIADHLIAAWPSQLYRPDWLAPYEHKTSYVGGISGLRGCDPKPARCGDARPTVLILAGRGGTVFTPQMVQACATLHPQYHWRTAGVQGWVDDIRTRLCAADVVVAHPGQGAVADIATAAKPAVLIPAERPFGEQHATAQAIADSGLAVTVPRCPAPGEWTAAIEAARRIDPRRWRLWRTDGAPDRAAAAIHRTAALTGAAI